MHGAPPFQGHPKRFHQTRRRAKRKSRFWWIKQNCGNDWKCLIFSLCEKAVFVRSTPVFMKTSSLETLETIQKDSKSRFGTVVLLFFWATHLPRFVWGCLTIFDLGGFFKEITKSPASGCQASVWPNFFRRLGRTTEAHVTPIVVALTHTNARIQVRQRSPRFPESLRDYTQEFDMGGGMKYGSLGRRNSGPQHPCFGTTSLKMGWSLGWPAFAPFSKEQNCSSCWEGIIYLWVGHHCTDVKLLVWLLAHFFQSPIQDRNTNSKQFLQQHALNSQTNI